MAAAPTAAPRRPAGVRAARVSYRETSLIVEAFTREYGRVAMVARGAKRPRSELRGLLQAFQPLLAVLGGQRRAQDAAAGGVARRACRCSAARRSLCGFYLNELLLKLLPREDPHPRAVRRLRGGACRRSPATAAEQATGAAPLRAAAARGAGLRAAAHARGRHRRPDRSGRALPLRVRPRRRAARACASRARAGRSCAARRCWRSRTAATPTPRPRPRRSA